MAALIVGGSVSPRARRWMTLPLRFGLGGLFLLAAVLKLRDPTKFALEIANYQLLPTWAPAIAAVLPAVEFVTGLALVAAPRAWRAGAALLASGLLAMFAVAVTTVRVRGINIDCGCFGGGEGPINGLTIARNGLLFTAAVILVWLERTSPSQLPQT